MRLPINAPKNTDFLHRSQEGQALLIVVLVMVVALTVGLAVATRSIINVRNTKEEENSQRAFSAAEAGVEQSLKQGTNQSGTITDNNTTYTTNVTRLGEGQTSFSVDNGDQIRQDEGADIWFVQHNADGTPNYGGPRWTGSQIRISWGSGSDPCNNAALEVIILSGSPNSPQTTHYTYDRCASRRITDNFSDANNGGIYAHTYRTSPITLPPNPLFARVVPLYATTSLAVDTPSVVGFFNQGNVIESLGVAGSTQRKIQIFKGYPQVPAELFYTLFSPNNS